MQNPLKKSRTFLRRKTDLLRDYLTGGTALLLFGLFISFQYKKINPPDPVDEPQYSQDYNILDFVQDKIRKITNIKYNQIQDEKQKQSVQKKNAQ
ncbi:unnamed protein product [Paramecium primaurelia]|uniref:Uncharacterized protein n=2 Tax=Paramecium TaxID=5884 RepID=A0A8S1UJX8_9CILI|nr:unnamed protein product [Paramecium primaurelia]CAD8165348.1 unnamed protein product [Paramecium pentaurelia]